MRARRQDFLGDEITVSVYRYQPAGNVHVFIRRNAGTADADRSAAKLDIVQTQPVFPVRGK